MLPMMLAAAAPPVHAQELGEAVDEADLAAWAITIAPDGTGLPDGAGSVRQGEALYAQWCAACHGENGIGGPAGALAGGIGSLVSPSPVKTVGSYWPYATTLFDYIRRAMPYDAPGTLSADETYAVAAYILHLNGILPADAALDATRLPQVVMPNRDGFIGHWPASPGDP